MSERTADNDPPLCTLCGLPLDTWPCDATWDSQHRPRAPHPPYFDRCCSDS